MHIKYLKYKNEFIISEGCVVVPTVRRDREEAERK